MVSDPVKKYCFFMVLAGLIVSGAASATHPAGTLGVPPMATTWEQQKLNCQYLYDVYPWSATFYGGVTLSNPLIRILLIADANRWPEHLYSTEIAYTLAETNPVRRLFSPIVGVAQVALDVAVRDGSRQHSIYEFDPYFDVRWANFPWDAWLPTSFAIGEGVSYDTSVPWIERKGNPDTKRLLNFLMLEATFALPNNPRLQFVARIHHRSGAYGLYHAGNTGSNVVGLGVRYVF